MHSLNYLLYTCSPLCKHLSSYDDKMHHCAKKQIKQNKETNTHKKYHTKYIHFTLGIQLTSPLIHHSGCGKSSCTAKGRRSLGKKVDPWPRRAPAAGRGTFWPTFMHTQFAYMRPLCAHWSQSDYFFFSFIYRNVIRTALSHRFAAP